VSPVHKVRVGSSWVETNLSGAVRLGGTTIAYGPSGEEPPAYEGLAYPSPPSITNAVDSGTEYSMGARFTLTTTPKPCYGVQWHVPNPAPIPDVPTGQGHVAHLWDISENLLASKEFVAIPGTIQDILFDPGDVVNLAVGPQYIVDVYTTYYSFRSFSGFPVMSASGNVSMDVSRLGIDVGPDAFPAGSISNALYYVGPLIGT
jgi:hypothetical protein